MCPNFLIKRWIMVLHIRETESDSINSSTPESYSRTGDPLKIHYLGGQQQATHIILVDLNLSIYMRYQISIFWGYTSLIRAILPILPKALPVSRKTAEFAASALKEKVKKCDKNTPIEKHKINFALLFFKPCNFLPLVLTFFLK